MEKFNTLTGIAAPMPLVNIDTDMIIPKQFLKTILRTGLGANLFDEMRFDREGNEVDDFVLNQPAYREAEILRLRFGLADGRSYTLEEVGKVFEVTRERIRQIEAKASKKLQKPYQRKQLDGFLPEGHMALHEYQRRESER